MIYIWSIVYVKCNRKFCGLIDLGKKLKILNGLLEKNVLPATLLERTLLRMINQRLVLEALIFDECSESAVPQENTYVRISFK